MLSGSILPVNKPDFLIIGAQKCGTTSFENGNCPNPK